MLQKPDLPDAALLAALRRAYRLHPAELTFLPLGADQATAVYRVATDEGGTFFLKLRSRGFDEVGVAIPRLLHDRGVEQVIPPIPTRSGRLWTRLTHFALVLYPFVDGRDGRPMSDLQWRALGAALRGLHAIELPPRLAQRVPVETFDDAPRDALRHYLARAESEHFDDPTAAAMAALLQTERARIDPLLRRSDDLAATLRANPPPFVLCHADVHAANVLLAPDDKLYLIDWDTLTYAPREHDFEQIDGAWGRPHGADLFYQGYGSTDVNQHALAYYRYRRIVEDLKVVAELLLDSDEGGANRAQELDLIVGALQPGGAVDLARELNAAEPAR